MRRYAVAGYCGHALVRCVFVTLGDDGHAKRLIRQKVARMQRPDLDWLIFECGLEPIERIEQTRDFQRWAKRQIARKYPAPLFDDER
jgi:hypothetical protein